MSAREAVPHQTPAFDSAPLVSLIDGEIVLLGPGATGFSMTAEAARETCRRLTLALWAFPHDRLDEN